MNPPPYETRTYVVRGNPTFCRAAHALIVTRFDRHGREYCYNVETFFGHDGRATRGAAMRRGAEYREYATRGKTPYLVAYRTDSVTSGFPDPGFPRAQDLPVL